MKGFLNIFVYSITSAWLQKFKLSEKRMIATWQDNFCFVLAGLSWSSAGFIIFNESNTGQKQQRDQSPDNICFPSYTSTFGMQ